MAAKWINTLTKIRPFARAHWTLFALFVIAWQVQIFSSPCNTGPYYVLLVMATVAVCLSFWINHVALAPLKSVSDWMVLMKRAIYDLCALCIVLILTGLPTAMVLPAYQCYTDRVKAVEVLLSSSVLKDEITLRALGHGKLEGSGNGLKIELSQRTKGGVVIKDGVIVLVGDDPPVVFMLTPTLSANEVNWKCLGYPEKNVPLLCKDR
jgi:hypothetical protein